MSSQRPQKPDWKFWRDIVDVALWEAIHLSLNVCPRRTDEDVLWEREQSHEYQDKLAVAASNLRHGKLQPTSHASEVRRSTTRLADFAAFAAKRWKIPPGLSELAADEPAKATPQEDGSLGQRQRDTYLVVIAALAKAQKIDVSKPSKAADVIAALTEEIGARVAPRTLVDLLKLIPEAKQRRSK